MRLWATHPDLIDSQAFLGISVEHARDEVLLVVVPVFRQLDPEQWRNNRISNRRSPCRGIGRQAHFCDLMDSYNSTGFSCANGRCPASIQYRVTPAED
jgi:hypothetical protein